MSNLSQLFHPSSIALLDSGFNQESMARILADNCISSGYEGNIHQVCIGEKDNHHDTSLESCLYIRGSVDVAAVTTTSSDTVKAVKDCVDKGLSYIMLWPQKGIEHGEIDDLAEYAKTYGSRIIGPGYTGLYNAESKLKLCLSPGTILSGEVSVITYNAHIGKAICEAFTDVNLGISSAIALGNKVDLNEADCLDYFKDDDSTGVIFLHIDKFFHDESLWRQMEITTGNKRVVALFSPELSNTAGDAGREKNKNILMKKLLEQCGALVADSLEEAADWCKALTTPDRMWTKENKVF
jgi:acetyl-CoA synthetase (ADP-forming)